VGWRADADSHGAEIEERTDAGALLFHGRRVGWRLAVCGEESRVLALAADARAAGLLDDELVIHAEWADETAWYCPSCGATTLQPAHRAVGDCSGCGRLLRRQRHWSSASGRYLAVPDGLPDGVPEPAASRRP
jgi:hypothetical protein